MKPITKTATALALLAVALPLAAARRTDDPLALIPADAASVGMVRLADLRTSPLASRLFSETDTLTLDGDAARFMEEASLRPKEDVDVVVFAGSPRNGGTDGSGLVLFEGRFDVDKLSAAIVARGARKVSTPNGDYVLLPNKGDGNGGRPDGAIAFASKHLVIAGTEDAVTAALARREAGGSSFVAGAGLGRHYGRIDSGATAWALVDVARWPQSQGGASHRRRGDDGEPTSMTGLVGAMKTVTTVALQATAKGDTLKLSATGLSSDEETRELLEDSIRGVLAAMRLAAQDKSPDAVSILRKFKVQRDGDSVSVSGTLPGSAVRALAEKGHKGDRSK